MGFRGAGFLFLALLPPVPSQEKPAWPSTAFLTVRVVRSDSRRPLSDAEVVGKPAEDPLRFVAWKLKKPYASLQDLPLKEKGALQWEHGKVRARTDSSGMAVIHLPAGMKLELRIAPDAADLDPVSRAAGPFRPGENASLDVSIPVGKKIPLEGRILEAGTGKPLAGGQVTLYRDGRILETAGVDSSGRYRVAGRGGKALVLFAEAEGFTPVVRSLGTGDAPPPKGVDLSLAPDADIQGALLPGGWFREQEFRIRADWSLDDLVPSGSLPFSLEGRKDPSRETVLRPDRTFVLRHLPAGVPLSLTFVVPGKGELELVPEMFLHPGESRGLSLPVPGLTTISGRVLDDAGRPVPGATVAVARLSDAAAAFPLGPHAGREDDLGYFGLGEHALFRTRTDAAGSYTLGPLLEACYLIGLPQEPGPPDYSPIGRVVCPQGRRVVKGVDIPVLRDLFLEGRLVSPAGKPVPRWTLVVERKGHPGYIIGNSRDDGTFRLGPLAPGLHEISLASRGSGPLDPPVFLKEAEAGTSGIVLVAPE